MSARSGKTFNLASRPSKGFFPEPPSIYPVVDAVEAPDFETTYGAEFCERLDEGVFRRSQQIDTGKLKFADDENDQEFDPYKTSSSAYDGGLSVIQAARARALAKSQGLSQTMPSRIETTTAAQPVETSSEHPVHHAQFAPAHGYGMEQAVTMRQLGAQPHDHTHGHKGKGPKDVIWSQSHAMGRLGYERSAEHQEFVREQANARQEQEADPAVLAAAKLESDKNARFRVYKRSYGIF